MLSWTRRQPGTTSLRAMLYFDEVFGYLPPHPANPPTKVPLMTLLKQARAFGVGVLLATQNPVDLDYKALSNAGIDRNTPVTLKLNDVPANIALERVLEQLGEGHDRPRWDVQDGGLTVRLRLRRGGLRRTSRPIRTAM